MPLVDFYIDPDTGDIDLNNIRLTTPDGEAVAQKVRIRLKFFFREWILNPDQGTKWLETVLKKGATDYNVNQEIQRRILGTEGVRALENYSFERNDAERSFSCYFDIITDFDTVESIVIEDLEI